MTVRVRRVVLAVDAAERTVRIVREAVEVASSLGAELEGLFVEDDALLRLAQHGFARRVGATGAGRELASGELEREWRALACEVREALEREARARSVRTLFAVERGAVEAALRARLVGGDVVIVAWGGWSPSALRRPAPVRVLYDGHEDAERALEVGLAIAGERGELVVWVAPDRARAADLAVRVRERVGDRVARVRFAGIEDAAPSTIRRAVGDEPGGFLIVPGGHELAARLAQRSVAARFPCSVVIVH
ncbi:MAG TPA: hypothetical protein VIL20_07385 [Sandaracinaceae bacterium]